MLDLPATAQELTTSAYPILVGPDSIGDDS